MLARVAENLFWLSRYLERSENTVRLINRHGNLLIDLPGINEHDGWMPLVSINGQDDQYIDKHGEASENHVNHFLIADRENDGSLVNAFTAIRNNLRSCRDVLPKVCYESINSLCNTVTKKVDHSYSLPSKRQQFLAETERSLQAISSSINNNMRHDLGYRIMRMGCYLERADMTSRIIDVQSSRFLNVQRNTEVMAIQEQRWVSVLKSLAAHQMYRQHIRRPVNGADTLKFLLQDQHLPRSYTFCLNNLVKCVQSLDNPEKIVESTGDLYRMLNEANINHLASDPLLLHRFIDELQLGLINVSQTLSLVYFSLQQDTE